MYDTPAVMITLLGPFGLVAGDSPTTLGRGAKTETLLSCLALAQHHRMLRAELLERLWPDSDASLAGQSLNSLTHRLNRLASEAVHIREIVFCEDGYYGLNTEDGIGVDVDLFDQLAAQAEGWMHTGEMARGIACCREAVALYRGDLSGDSDIATLIRRERLRATFLNLLARLADWAWAQGSVDEAMGHVQRMLAHDPCREDAHRRAMQGYARQGLRAQALRQYHLCVEALRREFDAAPEAATTQLYEQLRGG